MVTSAFSRKWMTGSENKRLEAFNQAVLRFQDELFTLAFYLTQDENRAASAAQEACLRCFREEQDQSLPFRLALLRMVIRSVRGYRDFNRDLLPTNILSSLKDCDRQAVLLVDVLGLSYLEAAQVLGCPPQRLAETLTRARLSVAAA